MRLEHHHVGLLAGGHGRAVALGELVADLAQHVVGHHAAQRRHVAAVPGVLQGGEVALGSSEESFGVEAGRDAPGLRTLQRAAGAADAGADAQAARCLLRMLRVIAAFPRARRRVVAHLLRVVLARLQRLVGAQAAVLVAAARHACRRRLRTPPHHADGDHHQEREQQHQQEVAEAGAETKHVRERRDAQACGESAEQAAPAAARRLRCGPRGRRLRRGLALHVGRRGGRCRRLALRHVGRLAADRAATAQAPRRVGIEGAEHQHGGEQGSPESHGFLLWDPMCGLST